MGRIIVHSIVTKFCIYSVIKWKVSKYSLTVVQVHLAVELYTCSSIRHTPGIPNRLHLLLKSGQSRSEMTYKLSSFLSSNALVMLHFPRNDNRMLHIASDTRPHNLFPCAVARRVLLRNNEHR